MAKSRLEPKKIVRYAESNVPRQGISGIPTPRIQRSTPGASPADSANSSLSSTGDAGTSVNTGGTSTPPPPPAPPVVQKETRGFVFDGATELTASFSNKGGKVVRDYAVAFTVAPGWAPEDTGSFVVFSVSNPADADDYRFSLFFERTSGSEGYQDYLSSQLTSASLYYKTSMRLSNSPNFHNVSSSNTGFAAYIKRGRLDTAFRNNSGFGFRAGTFSTSSLNNATTTDRFNMTSTVLTSSIYTLSIGGYNSGSNGYLTGSMDNFYIAKNIQWLKPHPLSKHIEKDKPIDIVYKFEGNVSASKGNQDLAVVGTETYVSSSLSF